jgi:uncharacterized DUF497 family protein
MRSRIEKTAKSTAFLLRLQWSSLTSRSASQARIELLRVKRGFGRVEDLNILDVVHTVVDERNEEVIRIISARKATSRERAFYEEVDG